MSIPTSITRSHIIRAMKRVDIEIANGTLPARRKARKYSVRYNNTDYPVKIVLSYANVFVNGVELDPDPRVFTTYLAQDYLINKEFEIFPKPYFLKS